MKSREEYVMEYLASVKKLGINIDPPTQQIEKTAEAAHDVDSYTVEPGDEPAKRSPPRRAE